MTIAASVLLSAAAQAVTLKSPDGHVVADIDQATDGSLQYRLQTAGRTALEPSALGLIAGGQDIARGAHVPDTLDARSIDTTFPGRGPHAQCHFACNEYVLPLGDTARIEFRVADDCFAYRYVIPAKDPTAITHIDGERSGWTIPAGIRVWFGERNHSWKLYSYAGEFISAPIEQMLENMFVGRPPGNYDRLLDFSHAVTGGLFFVPSADLLEALADRSPQAADADTEEAAAPALAPVAVPAPAPASQDGSLSIGSLKGTPQYE